MHLSRVQNRPDGHYQGTTPDTITGIVPEKRIVSPLLNPILFCDSYATRKGISGNMENELFPQIFIKQLPFKAHKTSNTSKNAYHQILTPPSKKVIKYIAKGCSSTWNNRWVLQTAHIPIYYQTYLF